MSPDLIPTSPARLRTLRLGLALCAAGWGSSFWFLVVSWESAVHQLQIMGLADLPYQPYLSYLLDMAASVFGCIGVAAGLACWRPEPFRGLVAFLVPSHLLVGTVLLLAAFRNHLDPSRYPTIIPDIVFCYVVALLIGVPIFIGRRWSKAA